MTGSRDKDDPLGETCKAQLLKDYIWKKYGRAKDISNKYIEKGLAVEELSITLYSRVKKTFYVKNVEVLENDYFIGTPDIIESHAIIDLKSSWSIHTFFETIHKPLNPLYKWQLQAYMDLTDNDQAKLGYCLVNTPENLINDAKRKLGYQMGVIDTDADETYIEACKQIDKEMIFDDIPIEERYIEFTIERDKKDIQKAYEKIELCREFLNELK